MFGGLFARAPKWQRVSSKENDEDAPFLGGESRIQRLRRIYAISPASNRLLGLLILSNCLMAAISTYALLFGPLGRNALLKMTSHWSPILDDVHIPMSTRTMNGTYFTPENYSLGRMEPSEEVDQIWFQNYELFPKFAITREQVIKLGKDPDKAARFPDDLFGLGEDAYMASMDVFHQIHCLNMIRRLAFEKYPTSPPKKHTGETYPWFHIGHCVDLLMQNIQCSGTTDFYTFTYVDTFNQPYPDFSINHKCRNFDTLVDWAEKNKIGDDGDAEYLAKIKTPPPADAWVWPAGWHGDFLELGQRIKHFNLSDHGAF